MAKEKTAVDVQLAEIQAGIEKSLSRDRTIVRCFAIVFGSAVLVAGFYLGAQVLDDPPWVKVTLAIIGTNGIQYMATAWVSRRLKRQVAKVEAEEAQPPRTMPESPPEGNPS